MITEDFLEIKRIDLEGGYNFVIVCLLDKDNNPTKDMSKAVREFYVSNKIYASELNLKDEIEGRLIKGGLFSMNKELCFRKGQDFVYYDFEGKEQRLKPR